MARELAEAGHKITVFDSRPHLAGNCHTERDVETGILIHQYGPHIFHTNSDRVWNYVNRFSTFRPYTNRVKAITDRGVFSLPINLLTLNQYFGKSFNPTEAQLFLSKIGTDIDDPKNLEEQALKFLGSDLYRSFFYGYTKKQWGREPRDLPKSILQRLPIRFNYNDDYYDSKFQGIPVDGYTKLIERILDHPSIEIILGHRYVRGENTNFDHVFFSGCLDSYFDFEFGDLSYRTLDFERLEGDGDFQGNSILNYCEEGIPFTRITEHKHFSPWENYRRTICFQEYSREATRADIPFYPVRLIKEKKLLSMYMERAQQEEKVTFIGRLGTYRYLDMDKVVEESLDLITKYRLSKKWPLFSNDGNN